MIAKYQLAVIGAGPGGMQAAITAAENGVSTILVDSYPQPGGQYYMQPAADFPSQHLSAVEMEGKQLSDQIMRLQIKTYFDACVWGIFKEENDTEWLVALNVQGQPQYVRAENLILANGAYDTPIAFPGWTLPGVISCGASLTFLKSQRFVPGSRVLITGTGPLLLSAAAHFISAGAKVAAICESNQLMPAGLQHLFTMLGQGKRLREGAKYFWQILISGTPYLTGWSIKEAHGQNRVEEVTITQLNHHGHPSGSCRTLPVDLVVSGYSLTPNTGLARMIGCQMKFVPERGGWVPSRNKNYETSLKGVFCVGDGAGIRGAENAILEGKIAALAIAEICGNIQNAAFTKKCEELIPALQKQHQFSRLYADLFTPSAGLISLADDDTIICRCEEVTLEEIKQAVAMGARTITEVKMITRSGMGNCQGRMCEHSISAAIVAALVAEEQTPSETGCFSVRPPLNPLPASFLADAAQNLE